MTDEEILEIYKQMLPFLGLALGKECELCVHDVRNPDHSLIAIENNATGRLIGDPMTDLAKEIVKNQKYTDSQFVPNYNGISKGKPFLSSTYFIKNGNRLIGLLCVNKNMSLAIGLDNAIRNFVTGFNLVQPEESEIRETLESSVAEILPHLVADVISNMKVEPERMTTEEKAVVVKKLQEQGILSMKGAVKEIAKQLNLSIPTIYRYLNK